MKLHLGRGRKKIGNGASIRSQKLSLKSFERVKGKRFNGDILRFPNPVMTRVAGKVQGRVMSERWF